MTPSRSTSPSWPATARLSGTAHPLVFNCLNGFVVPSLTPLSNSRPLFPLVCVRGLHTHVYLNPFRTAVLFWGQWETHCLEFEWLVPKAGLEF